MRATWFDTGDGVFPSTCLAEQSQGQLTIPLNVSVLHAAGGMGSLGQNWRSAAAITNSFQTILPPNSPSCQDHANAMQHHLASATSHHTGGVNASRMDGSVMFVPETISTTPSGGTSNFSTPQEGRLTFADRSRLSLPSPYGVWGALGAINSGQSVSL